MLDLTGLNLLLLILSRMSGLVLFNPLLGRSNIPAYIKSGLILLLSFTTYSMTGMAPPEVGTVLEMGVLCIWELGMGYLLGLAVNLFFYVPLLGGEIIDIQMGMSMGRTYDPSSQASATVTATLLNVLMSLLFFAANGHITLLRIMLTSGEIVPFGQVMLGRDVLWSLLELFVECTVLAVKLCMPILAAELLGQVGMGILMKVIPQINVFAINIELKVIIGLGLLLILLVPFSEYLLGLENQMFQTLRAMLPMMAG
ncbi:MAG: flagellar biosynthetic protein FliR [Oscillospiraceae bacterium]|nr:flagellar biosynthetic protein FliR [Oscillospiraceae bacterium]